MPRGPRPTRAPQVKPTHCAMDGCDALLYARGWCKPHYEYHWRFEQRVAEAFKRGGKPQRIDDPDLKTCPKCEGQFPLTYYPPSKRKNYVWVCHPCAMDRLSAERLADRERFAAYRRNTYRSNGGRYRGHKITEETAAAMLASQGGVCPVCTDPIDLADTRQTAIDHDHSCCPGHLSCGKCIRAILCRSCNSLVGHLELRPERVERALLFIKGGTL